MSAGYVVAHVAAQALAAATAETMIMVINSTNGLIRITEIGASFDGVSSAAVPVTLDLCSSTQAGAGTPTTSPTPLQIRGAARAALSTGGEDYTAEPTVLTVIKSWFIRADGGLFILQNPLGREVEQPTTVDGLCLRATAPAIVNALAYIEFEEG